MKFVKMQGTGNDFVVIDDRNNLFLGKEEGLAKKICDRRFSVGGDGILLVRNSNKADIEMVIFNADGSYAEMCGNGIRCFAKYIYDEKIVHKLKISIQTGDGIKIAEITENNGKAQNIKINMGMPSFETSKIPALIDEEIIDYDLKVEDRNYKITSMLMGVPHTVVIGKLDEFAIEEGRAIEKSKEIFPRGTNVNFCEVVNGSYIKVKTWERGAGATLACGTGCCAAAVACNKLGLTSANVDVEVPGGSLHIDITETFVYMTGEAKTTFSGDADV